MRVHRIAGIFKFFQHGFASHPRYDLTPAAGVIEVSDHTHPKLQNRVKVVWLLAMQGKRSETRGERLLRRIANISKAMSHAETQSLPKRKAELEAEYHSMSGEVRQQVIPQAEASKERAELRIIAKEIVRDFRKTVVQRRRDLRQAEKELSEICKWYGKSFGER